jgi:hypothetical protein
VPGNRALVEHQQFDIVKGCLHVLQSTRG